MVVDIRDPPPGTAGKRAAQPPVYPGEERNRLGKDNDAVRRQRKIDQRP